MEVKSFPFSKDSLVSQMSTVLQFASFSKKTVKSAYANKLTATCLAVDNQHNILQLYSCKNITSADVNLQKLQT
jgi:hypothetical protein